MIHKALTFSRPGEKWYLVGNNYSGLQWLDSTTKPTEDELNIAIEVCTKTKKISDTKLEAKRRIEQIIPQGIQLRTLTKGVVLTKKLVDGTITSDELIKLQELQDLDSTKLQPIRDASGLIEKEIEKLSGVALENYDVVNNLLWP